MKLWCTFDFVPLGADRLSAVNTLLPANPDFVITDTSVCTHLGSTRNRDTRINIRGHFGGAREQHPIELRASRRWCTSRFHFLMTSCQGGCSRPESSWNRREAGSAALIPLDSGGKNSPRVMSPSENVSCYSGIDDAEDSLEEG
eukprot:gene12954-biopygen3519